jgi:hypothetical protein
MYTGKYTTVPIPPPVLVAHVHPLLKEYHWRCASEDCGFLNKTMGTEEGHLRELPSGNTLREPCWYHVKCEFCREEAGRECCLVEVKLVEAVEKSMAVVEGKGKGKEKMDEGQGEGLSEEDRME